MTASWHGTFGTNPAPITLEATPKKNCQRETRPQESRHCCRRYSHGRGRRIRCSLSAAECGPSTALRTEPIWAINWGFVAGKTQTYLPWDSWQHPYVLDQPPVWFHEVLRPDGTPYRQAEADLIRQLTRKP